MVNSDWLIEVDARQCIGSGLCASSAPAYFTLTANRSKPVRAIIDPDEVVLDAAECCPMEAITVKHADDGSRIAPVP